MSARGRMWRRIALALLLSALAVAKLEGLIDFGGAAIAVVFAFFMYVSFLGVCRMRGRTRFKPEDDDDAGIDWREKGCVDAEPEMSGYSSDTMKEWLSPRHTVTRRSNPNAAPAAQNAASATAVLLCPVFIFFLLVCCFCKPP